MITYINQRAERHATQSISNYDNYRVVNANHEIAKARRAQDRADRLRRANAMVSRVFIATLLIGVLYLLTL